MLNNQDTSMFKFLDRSAPFFTLDEQAQLVNAIRTAEGKTSGEIRLFVESHNPYVEPMERAFRVFKDLKMENTEKRNAVLIYVAMKDHELAIFGDQGIDDAVGKEFWRIEVVEMLRAFKGKSILEGLLTCINHVGRALEVKFPYEASTDKNELPDDIVFGR